MEDAAAVLAGSRYLNLGTYRRSGTVVDTPLWFAKRGDQLIAFTQAGSGKLKRLRASPRARVAACDVRGRLEGPWLEARAQIVADPVRAEAGLDVLRRRYGWQFRALELGARLSGRRRTWTVLEIELLAAARTGS
jgi:PPOX class probable F420-dependent enzyme